MGYKETPETEDDENLDIAADLSLVDVDEELSFQDGDETEFTTEEELETEIFDSDELPGGKKAKAQPNKEKTFSLQARRAIEDHLEQRRLRKELDYLFDDEFANNEDSKK